MIQYRSKLTTQNVLFVAVVTNNKNGQPSRSEIVSKRFITEKCSFI